MNSTSHHWTEDPVLLEQFVMGRISEERLVQLRDHLATCAACRETVEKEKEFVGTVRAYGRDRLRLRLKEKIERSPSRVVPWPHVLSAAAIVLLVVGLGIYNRWWKEPVIVQSEQQIAAGGKDVVPPAPEAAGEQEDTGTTGRTADIPATGIGQPPRSDLAAKTLAEKSATEVQKKEKRARQIARDDKEPSFAERPRQAITADEPDDLRHRHEEYWIDGTLLDMISAKEGMRAEYRENDSAGAPGRGELKDQLSLKQPGNYVLQQQPEAALPREQQRLQKGVTSVPTKVSPTNDGAILTIYTDRISLQNRAVQGQFAGSDSLIFLVDGIRIAYKLPPAALK